MPKPELDYFDVERLEWRPLPGRPGAWEKILSMDEETGSCTRLVKFDPDYEGREVLVHGFWEEVYILKGHQVDLSKNQTFTKGMYACRPPGMKHGPYRAPQGSISLEFRYKQ
ncbi:MAG: hypothetical protein GTN80_11140 [Nitrososphaeria archaeon]|nr:hypothetical protein [Nitrososphaeria archaeon]NIQ34172.1 hypothetical protein [Nitrososphaeria archaeon]